jgi:hypothetical protein
VLGICTSSLSGILSSLLSVAPGRILVGVDVGVGGGSGVAEDGVPSACDSCYTCGDMCGTLVVSEYIVMVVDTNFKSCSTVMHC